MNDEEKFFINLFKLYLKQQSDKNKKVQVELKTGWDNSTSEKAIEKEISIFGLNKKEIKCIWDSDSPTSFTLFLG